MRFILNYNHVMRHVRPEEDIRELTFHYSDFTSVLNQLNMNTYGPNNTPTEMLDFGRKQSSVLLDPPAERYKIYRFEHETIEDYLENNLENSLLPDGEQYYSNDLYTPFFRERYYGPARGIINEIDTISNRLYASSLEILGPLQVNFTTIQKNNVQELLAFRDTYGLDICSHFDDFVINFGPVTGFNYTHLVASVGLVFSDCISLHDLNSIIDVSTMYHIGHIYSVLKMSKFIAWSVQPHAYSGIALALNNKYLFVKLLTDVKDQFYNN